MKAARSTLALLLGASPRSIKKVVRAITPKGIYRRLVGLLKGQASVPEPPAEAAPLSSLSARQLEDLLWGGFAHRAAHDLEKICQHPETDVTDAVLAARALARYHTVNGAHGKALEYLALIRRQDADYKRNNRILEIHCLLQLGNVAEARSLIEDAVAHGIPHDGCMNAALASSWMLEARQQRVSAEKAVAAYLEHMNRPLHAGGHVGVKLKDPSRPLALDNLTAESCPPTPEAMPAKVSVLMAVYNGVPHAATAIRSILEQSWSNLELVIVDDASTDKSWQLIKQFAGEDDRIIPIRHSRNGGAYVARNTALAQATGDFVVVNDADDWAHPQKIEAQVTHLLQHPNVRANMTFRVRVASDMTAMPRLDSAHVPIIHNDYSALMLPRERAMAMGGWDTVRFGADAEFVERLLAIDGPQAMQRIRGGMPLSFSLWDENNLTTNSATGIWTNHFGARNEYVRQYREWHASADSLHLERRSQLDPFPVPALCWQGKGATSAFDVILVADFRGTEEMLEDTFRHIREFHARGLRTALLSWPRYSIDVANGINAKLTATCRELGIPVIVHGEHVSTCLLLVQQPDAMTVRLEQTPTVTAEHILLLADPASPDFAPAIVQQTVIEVFGRAGKWIRNAEMLSVAGGMIDMLNRTASPKKHGIRV